MSDELTQYQSNLPAPTVTTAEWAQRRKQFNEWVNTQLKPNVDYGTVPGTDKRTLLKPGAEKILQLYGCSVLLDVVQRDQDRDTGYLYIEYAAKAVSIQSGHVVAMGVGACSSYESKYRWRWEYWNAKGQPTEAEWERGWNKSKRQEYFRRRIENRDLIDQWNTVIKMAKKRAMVDLALTISGASEKFTQDMEDFVDAEYTVAEPEAPKPAETPKAEPAEHKHALPPEPKAAPTRPYAPEIVKHKLLATAAKANDTSIADAARRGAVAGNLEQAGGNEQARHLFLDYVFGIKSSKDLTNGQAVAIGRWLNCKDDDGNWQLVPEAVEEMKLIVREQQKALGQQDMFEEAA